MTKDKKISQYSIPTASSDYSCDRQSAQQRQEQNDFRMTKNPDFTTHFRNNKTGTSSDSNRLYLFLFLGQSLIISLLLRVPSVHSIHLSSCHYTYLPLPRHPLLRKYAQKSSRSSFTNLIIEIARNSYTRVGFYLYSPRIRHDSFELFVLHSYLLMSPRWESNILTSSSTSKWNALFQLSHNKSNTDALYQINELFKAEYIQN